MDKITEQYQRMQMSLEEQYILTENRIEFLKKTFKDKISTEHDQLATKKDSDSIIDHFAEHDPTEKKEYTQWMVGQYRKGNVRQEDAQSMGETVGLFHGNKQNMEQKDINTFKHIADLRGATERFKEKKEPEFLDPKEAEFGTEKVYEAPGIKAFKIKNATASRAMGSGTSWCTNQEQYFDHYTKGKDPTFVIMTKEGNKFQIHHSTNQFKSEDDREVSPSNPIYQKYQNHFTKIIDQTKPEGHNNLSSRFGTVTDKDVDDLVKKDDWEFRRSNVFQNVTLSRDHINKLIAAKSNHVDIASFGNNPNITEADIRGHFEKHGTLNTATRIGGGLHNHPNVPADIVQAEYAKSRQYGESNFHKLETEQAKDIVSSKINAYTDFDSASVDKHPDYEQVLGSGNQHFHNRHSAGTTRQDTLDQYVNGDIEAHPRNILENPKIKPKHIESLYFKNHDYMMREYDIAKKVLGHPNTPSSVLLHAIDNHQITDTLSGHALNRKEIKDHVLLDPKKGHAVARQMMDAGKFSQEEKHQLVDKGFHHVLKPGQGDTPELVNKAIKASNGNVSTYEEHHPHVNDESLQIIAKTNPHRLDTIVKDGKIKNVSAEVIKNIEPRHKEIIRSMIKKTKDVGALQHVYDNGNHLDKQKVLMHPNVPESLLQKHADDFTMHGAISANPKIPGYIARSIAENPMLNHVKENLLKNKNVPSDVKEMLK